MLIYKMLFSPEKISWRPGLAVFPTDWKMSWCKYNGIPEIFMTRGYNILQGTYFLHSFAQKKEASFLRQARPRRGLRWASEGRIRLSFRDQFRSIFSFYLCPYYRFVENGRALLWTRCNNVGDGRFGGLFSRTRRRSGFSRKRSQFNWTGEAKKKRQKVMQIYSAVL